MTDLKIIDKENFKDWLISLEDTCVGKTMEVADELGNIGKEKSQQVLSNLKRRGKLPKKRGVHMYQDVKKVVSKKYGYVSIGGGKKTGTLWHIVNDGTYKTKATHFMDSVLTAIDTASDKVWDKKARELNGND